MTHRTYTGLNVQLASLLIPLFEELSGYQLCNLHQRKDTDVESLNTSGRVVLKNSRDFPLMKNQEHDNKSTRRTSLILTFLVPNAFYYKQKLARVVFFLYLNWQSINNAKIVSQLHLRWVCDILAMQITVLLFYFG